MWEDDKIFSKRLKWFVLYIKGSFCLLCWTRTCMCWRVVVNRQLYNGSWESNLETCPFPPNLFPLLYLIYILIYILILAKCIPQDPLLACVKLNLVKEKHCFEGKGRKKGRWGYFSLLSFAFGGIVSGCCTCSMLHILDRSLWLPFWLSDLGS